MTRAGWILLLGGLALPGCTYEWKAIDVDGDGKTPEQGDCWDAVEGPEGSGLTGADILPGAQDTWYDGVDQDCAGDNDFDQDVDGYSSSEYGGDDCDDEQTVINPGALETCGGVDEDCDGLIDDDDDSLEPSPWYLDGDDDGYGSEEALASGCDAAEGYSIEGGDCDDGRAEVYPGADEYCDDLDQDCDGETRDDESKDGTAFYRDSDGDGYGDPDASTRACDAPEGYVDPDFTGDCDDTNPDIHPGAAEVCDELDVDEDCDNLVDDDDPNVTGTTSWYTDNDGDGYGDTDLVEERCAPGADQVSDDEDCDDTDAGVNPGATEVCDSGSVDEDCDGKVNSADSSVDPDSTRLAYTDSDSDGYGTGSGTEVCDLGAGQADNADDCDDDDDATYPGATEECGDGEVNDCDASDEEALADCVLGSGDLGDATSTLRGAAASYELGGAVAGVGDYSGDGVGDLLIGAAGVSSGAGGAFLVKGAVKTGKSSLGGTGSAFAIWSGGSAEQLGAAVAGCDVDGDGTGDVILGAPGASSSKGAIYVLYGPSTSAVTSADLTLIGSATIAKTGSALSCGGDADGDGRADIAVGSPGFTLNKGGTNIIAYDATSGSDVVTEGLAKLNGASGSTDQLGASVAYGPDLNGDGVLDLVAGAPGVSSGAGAAQVVYGPMSGTLTEDLTLSGSSASAAGTSVASVGDSDGDGYEDLLVGAPSYDSGATDRGAVYLVLGAASLTSIALSTADAVLTGGSAGDLAGTSVAGAGDTNGDGLADLAIGAPGQDSGGSAAGAAYLLYGPVTAGLTLSAADVVLTGEAAGDEAGSAVGGAGDTNDDGIDELLVGAPGYDTSSYGDVGAVYLLSGGY